MADSFVFYRSFYESIRALDPETQLAFLTAVMEYALNEEEIPLPVVPKALFTAVKPQIDANRKRQVVGSLGGRPKKETEGFEEKNHRFSEEKTIGYVNEKPNVNENVNVNVNANVNENVKEKKMCSKEHIKEIVDAWNSIFSNTDVPKVTVVKSGSLREKAINARLKDNSKEELINAMHSAAQSSFLTSSSWFSFDWFMKPNNFVKVIEGNYADHAQKPAPQNKQTDKLQDFYDMAVKWAEGG